MNMPQQKASEKTSETAILGKAAIGPHREPHWGADEAKNLAAIARSMFRGHAYEHVGIDADNCSYCALTSGGPEGPNYAGWGRLYVEAGRLIPGRWREAFQCELESDNAAYAAALRRSIATFGEPKFTADLLMP
jgi:hypothetical protein